MDANIFNVFLAVPPPDMEDQKIKFTEHVYTISEEDLASTNLSDEMQDDQDQIRNKGRRRFRECQSGCVQSTCVPVRDVADYTECANNCKIFCSK